MINSIDINAVVTCEVLDKGELCGRAARWRIYQSCPSCIENNGNHDGSTLWCNQHTAMLVMQGLVFRCTDGPEPVITNYADMIQKIERL